MTDSVIKGQMSELHIDEAELERLLRAGEKLLPELLKAIKDCELFEPPLSIRSRIKRKEDIVAKIRRRRPSEPEFNLSGISDVIGLRFITLLRQDIVEVVDNIFKIVAPGSAVAKAGHFSHARLIDFTRFGLPLPPANDQELENGIDRLQDGLNAVFASRHGLTAGVELKHQRRAQYSSVHIHFQIPVSMDGNQFDVPVEIQVRSVFEDAWGEFDHMLFYESDRKGRSDGQAGDQSARPAFDREGASRQLRVLKGMLDNAEEYAAVISGRNPVAPSGKPPDIKANLDGLDYIRELCAPLTVNRELLNEFVGLTNDKIELDESVKSGAADLSAYPLLATKFANLATKLNAGKAVPAKDAQRYRSVLYMLAMEEALCRLLSGDRRQMLQAAVAYRSISEKYPEYPTCKFRLAQACAQILEKTSESPERDAFVGEAAENYRRARELLDRTPLEQLLLISPGQRTYLDENIERLRGFVLWRRSDLRRKAGAPDTQRDLEDLTKAYSIAESGLERERRKAGEVKNFELLNNATYFALEARKLADKLGVGLSDIPELPKISSMVRELERICLANKVAKVQQWHTILVGYRDVGETSDAGRIAEKVLSMISEADKSKLSDYDREVHERAVPDAWQVIKTHLPAGR